MWLLLIVFAVTVNLCIYKTSVSAQSCTPCFGGEALTNTNGRSAVGIPCSFIIAQTNGADSNTTFCQDTQMSAYQGCGCSEYDESTYCSMCNNSFYDIDVRDRPVPLFPGKNCEQLLFPRRDSGICDDVERAAYHCMFYVKAVFVISLSKHAFDCINSDLCYPFPLSLALSLYFISIS